jgi:mono/diheme cytochrome c family protein
MTFILGLVAEPIPSKFVYSPRPERAAEVRGRAVLDKYNCGGCHQVRPGVYEFKKTPELVRALESFHSAASGTFATDHVFPDHTAWVGRPSPLADRVTAYAVPGPEQPEGTQILRLIEALRIPANGGTVAKSIPAGSSIAISTEAEHIQRKDVISQSAPYGGTFAELMVPYLRDKDRTLYGDYKNARAALPPPLFREGEKVQPGWLFQFLRNPSAIRPVTVLRMPRFNMSDDEAMALVNYFAASDRLSNPGEGLSYPYIAVPQHDDAFWQARSREYVARLSKEQLEEQQKALAPIWEQYVRNRMGEVERTLKTAYEIVQSAKDDAARKEAEKNRDAVRKELDELKTQVEKKSFDALNQQWAEKNAYAADAWRLLANYNNPCLACHQAGPLAAKQAQGPPLDLAWERLRPDWTLRWLANPDRLISYPTPMPQNFARTEKPYPEFNGTILEQATAVRDILMNLPRIADLPVNRYHRPAAAAQGAKP